MLETIKDILIALTFAGVCALAACLLKTQKQQLLTIAADLIQKVEIAIRGSGLGAKKKAMVIAQLQAMDITVNHWLSAQVDCIVAYLNSKSAWFAASAGDTVTEITETEAEGAKSDGDH